MALTQELIDNTKIITVEFIENKLQNINSADAIRYAIHEKYADKAWEEKVAILCGLLEDEKQDLFRIFFNVFLTSIISADFTIEQLNISIADGPDVGKTLLFLLLEYKFEEQYNSLLKIISTKVPSKKELNKIKIAGDQTYLATLSSLDENKKFIDLYESLRKDRVSLYDINKSIYVNSDEGPTLLYALAMKDKRDLYKKLYNDLRKELSAKECNAFSVSQSQEADNDKPSVIFQLAYYGNSDDFKILYDDLLKENFSPKDINFSGHNFSCLYQLSYNDDMTNYDIVWNHLCQQSVSAQELNLGDRETSLLASLIEGGHRTQYTKLYDKLLSEGISAKGINQAVCIDDDGTCKSILLLLLEDENWFFANIYIENLIKEKVAIKDMFVSKNWYNIFKILVDKDAAYSLSLLLDAGFFEDINSMFSEQDMKNFLNNAYNIYILDDNYFLKLAFSLKLKGIDYKDLLSARKNRPILSALLECANIEIANQIINSSDIPEEYQDVITKSLILYPVTLSSGITYDKGSILTWMNECKTRDKNPTCCQTNYKLDNDDVSTIKKSHPNVIIQAEIVKIIENLRIKLTYGNIDNTFIHASASSHVEELNEKVDDIESKKGTTLKRRLTM